VKQRISSFAVGIVLYTFCPYATALWAQTSGAWSFAVSGDSRNCGDVVMGGIAAGVRADRAEFYWHLGYFRARSDSDHDLRAVPE